MPKNNIDYSKSIIYKIYCKNEGVSDLYVGRTTNFCLRRNQHKKVVKDNLRNIYIPL